MAPAVELDTEFEFEPDLELELETELELEAEIGRTELLLDQELDSLFRGRFEFEAEIEPEEELELELEFEFESELETEPFGFDEGVGGFVEDRGERGGFFGRLLDFPARRDPFGDFVEELEDVTGGLLTGFDGGFARETGSLDREFEASQRELEEMFQ